mgnify:CR=1 FL=1
MKNAIKYCCAIMILVIVSLNTTNADAKTYNVNYAKTISLYEGKSIQLKWKGKSSKVKWYSSDGFVAVVNQSGKVKLKNAGKVFSIEQIYESIWNEDAIGADNTVAVHIRHIREKIEINPKEPRYLKVVWGVGYKIDKEQA